MNVFLSDLQLTVNSVVEFFRTGRGVDLKVLTSATLSKLEKIKEKTAAGQFGTSVVSVHQSLLNHQIHVEELLVTAKREDPT